MSSTSREMVAENIPRFFRLGIWSTVAEGLRLDDIAKSTGSQIRAVYFNEKGDLVAAVEAGLGDVAVDGFAGDAPHLQQPGQPVGHVLGVAEGDESTGSQIRAVYFNEKGDLVAAVEAQ